jgi:hypothetical protein
MRRSCVLSSGRFATLPSLPPVSLEIVEKLELVAVIDKTKLLIASRMEPLFG